MAEKLLSHRDLLRDDSHTARKPREHSDDLELAPDLDADFRTKLEQTRISLLNQKNSRSRWALLLLLSVTFLFLLIWLKRPNLVHFTDKPWLHAYSLLVVIYLGSRLILSRLAEKRTVWLAQQPYNQYPNYPFVSVVIVAKNEVASIYKTIETCYNTFYPARLMEVIVLDDGSTDDTLAEMMRAKKQYESLKVAGFRENKGKRFGMKAGVERAKGEIVVFVDSDSFLMPDAIGKIVDAFRDPEVKAVSGRTDVENWSENLLTKMQAFRYFIAFKLMKAAESLFGSVTCCPGCFSAYRKSELEAIFPLWIQQTFLGKLATYGDDRSLTTMVLERGHRVLYKDDAICTTLVPTHWPKYLKQQVRWKKSWIRETLLASRFMWKRHPVMAFSFYVAAILPFLTPIVTFANLVYAPVWLHRAPVYYLFGLVVMCGLYSCYYAYKRRDGLWWHGVVYSFIYATLLVFQMPYALLTIRRTQWGTR